MAAMPLMAQVQTTSCISIPAGCSMAAMPTLWLANGELPCCTGWLPHGGYAMYGSMAAN